MIGAQDTIEERPWLTLFPGAFILLAVLSVSLIGDAVRDALDPGAAPVREARRWAP
jgi:ABC-type dipeptide/oligopeptide/nickel transport system permease subunit